MEPLTSKQQEILDFLKQEILRRGFPPSVREICQAVGLKSTSSVHAQLNKLEMKGYIRRDPDKPRAIEILDGFQEQLHTDLPWADNNIIPPSEIVNVPVVGRVAAGEPLLAVENVEDYFPIPVNLLPNSETFLLKVRGKSMINAGILDGDYVLVEKRPDASNGEMVVALIEDSATVKTFYQEDGYVRLQPENDYMEPIIVKEGLYILGKVIGVMRFL